jgi:DNA-binding NtrC family response regulator
MSVPLKKILIVAHNPPVRETRGMLLDSAGDYALTSVSSDDDAMAILETEAFDLVLIGRSSRYYKKGLDQRIRERHPNMLVLKIDNVFSSFPSRMTDSVPTHVLTAIREMLA